MAGDSAGGKEVGRISIRVTPNLKGFYKELKSKLEQIEDTLKARINVEPDFGNFRSEVAAKTKGMSAQVKVTPNVDRRQFQAVGNLLSNIQTPKFPFGGGSNPAGLVTMLAGITLVAAPLIGLITSALFALPGLISAVAVPIGALMLGLDGLKSAASRLAQPFADLKKTLSGAVESQLGPVFDQLGKIFPKLTTSLPLVTKGLANVAQSFVDTVTSAPGMAKIQATITNIGAAISRSAPGIASFTDGLLTLAEKFTSKLPAVADWFNGAADSFKGFIDQLNADGRLDTMFDGLGATLKAVMDSLGSIAKVSLDFFKDPKNIQNFAETVRGVGRVLEGIVAISNRIAAVWGVLAWLLRPVTTLWSQIANTMMTAVGQILLAMANIRTTIGSLVAGIGSALSGIWSGLAAAASAAWNGVVGAVQAAIGAITGIVAGIGNTLAGIWNGIASAATAAWGSVTSTVSSAIATVVSTVVSAGGQVLAEVSSWPSRIVGALGDLAGQLASAARAAAEAFVSNLASGLLAGIGRVAAAAASLMGSIAKFIPHSPAEAGPFSGAGWLKVTGFGDTIGNQLAQGLQNQESKVAAAMTGVMNAAQGAMFDFSKPVDMATGFARANLDQAMSDLGIGGGALSNALKAGMDWGAQSLSKLAGSAGQGGDTYNISNVDEAIALRNNKLNKLALQYTRA